MEYSGYPDCRPEFIDAYEEMADLATTARVVGNRLAIHTPLIDLTKAEIIQEGMVLGLDDSMTVSCYQADQAGRPRVVWIAVEYALPVRVSRS